MRENRYAISLDEFEHKAVVSALYDMRSKYIEQGTARGALNNFILKVIHAPETRNRRLSKEPFRLLNIDEVERSLAVKAMTEMHNKKSAEGRQHGFTDDVLQKILSAPGKEVVRNEAR